MSAITVTRATGTEAVRRIADISHLSRSEPSPLKHVDVRSYSCDDRGECGARNPRIVNRYTSVIVSKPRLDATKSYASMAPSVSVMYGISGFLHSNPAHSASGRSRQLRPN